MGTFAMGGARVKLFKRITVLGKTRVTFQTLCASLVVLGALMPMLLLRGFTVDDAWIAPRYAAHWASGEGYCFNPGPGAPITDGVTPLPWVPLLVLLSGGGTVGYVWSVARWTGAISWLAMAALLGAWAARAGDSYKRLIPLLGVLLSAPLAAWSVAGMETGCVTALATGAAIAPWVSTGNHWGCFAAGLTAAFRPEMAVFAGVLGVGRAGCEPRMGRRFSCVLLAVMPWFAVMAIRIVIFGHAAPLSLFAKPSDIRHGFAYVVSGLLLGGAPALACAPLYLLGARKPAFNRLKISEKQIRWITVACIAHALTVMLAGGDWMPLSRLLVPVFPPLLVVAIRIANQAPLGWTLLRTAVAVAGMLFVWKRVGNAARGVVEVRHALIEQARAELAESRVIAAVDIGWLGAVSDATVVDLAGITDPSIAFLPGGHTSKRIPAALLAARGVDTLIFLKANTTLYQSMRKDGGPYARAVEESLIAEPWVAENFTPQADLHAGGLCYGVLRRREAIGSKQNTNVPYRY